MVSYNGILAFFAKNKAMYKNVWSVSRVAPVISCGILARLLYPGFLKEVSFMYALLMCFIAHVGLCPCIYKYFEIKTDYFILFYSAILSSCTVTLETYNSEYGIVIPMVMVGALVSIWSV